MFTRALEARERFVQWLQGRPKTRWLMVVPIYGMTFAAGGVVLDGGSLSFNAVAGEFGFGVVVGTIAVFFEKYFDDPTFSNY